MRTCHLCKSTHPDEVNVCPVDGSTLDARAARLDATASIEPPSGAMRPFESPFDSGIDSDDDADNTSSTLPPVDPEEFDEKTRQDRPAHRRIPPRARPPVPSVPLPGAPRPSATRMAAAGAGVSQTSELERNDFSALLSSAPGGAQLEPPESRIGKVLGSYRLIEIIGRGGMGCVYRAEHVKIGRDVALKLLREDYAQRRDAVTRFFHEARAVNLIRHRNIVDVIDYVELDDGNVFIIMELLAGDSLGKLMRGPIELGRAIGILAQICDGLSAAHAVGIVHRDLKPDNIIIGRAPDGGDLVKILDFGVAKLVDKYTSDPDLTAVGSVIGTPAYMSPEQAGGLAVDPRADVYALGAIMYEMFTQQPLFRAGTFGEFVRRHMNETPVRPSKLRGCEDIDPGVEALIMRCLEKGPDKRYQSALELRANLVGLLSVLETQAPSPSAPAARPQPATPRASGQMKASVPPPIPAAAKAAAAAGPRAPTPPPEPDAEADSDGEEATIEVVRDASVRRAIAGAAPQAARETGPRRHTGPQRGAGMPGQPERATGDAAWNQDAGAAPVAFGTPSPYDSPALDALRRSSPALPSMPSGPLSSKLAAQLRPMAGGYDSLTEMTGPPRRRRLLIILAAVTIVLAAGIATAIPALTGISDDPAPAPASATPAAAGPVPADPAAGPVTNAVTTTDTPAAPGTESAAGSGAAADSATTDSATSAGATSAGAATGSPTTAGATEPPRAGERSTDTSGPDHRDDRSAPRAAAGKDPVRVRVVSRPVGELHAAGRRGVLCETPCALTINPRDGGSAQRRIYVIKRPGYKDETITIDLTEPPRDVRVELKKLRVPGRADGDDEEDEGTDGPGDARETGDDAGDEPGKSDPDSTFNPFSDPAPSRP
jgi:serine/threonine-protein kinase